MATYRIDRRVAGTTAFQTVGTFTVTGPGPHDVTITGLTNDVAYDFRVVRTDLFRTTEVATATPEQLGDLTIEWSDVASGSVTVAWVELNGSGA
jgi:hypothetical protein